MGQRHQFYVIARIVSHSTNGETQEPRYRCVAAIHHQWMRGRQVPTAALLFLELCRNPYTAGAIRAELASIGGRFGAYGEAEPKIDDRPCPYISQMLCLSVYMRAPGGIPYTCSFIPVSYGSSDYDNDDGITIFDVTDPLECRYCHMFLQSDGQAPKPLSAVQYVESYGRYLTQYEASRFKSIPLISPNALAEAWPWEYTITEPSEGNCDVGENPEKSTIPSLSSMAHNQLLPILHSENAVELLPNVVLDGTMKSFQQRHLLALDEIQGADLALLLRVVQHDININEDFLDLSGMNLHAEDIIGLPIGKGKIRYMDISSSSTFSPTVKDLVSFGKNFPLLEWANMINCPKVDAEAIKVYYRENRATYHIIHPSVMVFPQRMDVGTRIPTPIFTSQFAVVLHTFDRARSNTTGNNHRWIGASTRFFNLAPALQIVHDILSRNGSQAAPLLYYYDNFCEEFMAYLTSGSHLTKSPWPSRPFLGLPDKIFKFRGGLQMDMVEPWWMIPEKFTAWSFLLHENYAPVARDEKGGWLKLEDQPQPNLEYAFIRFEDCKAMEICDLQGFLQRNRPLEGAMERELVDNMKQVLAKDGHVPTLDPCGDVDPDDIIRRVLTVLPEKEARVITEEIFSKERPEIW